MILRNYYNMLALYMMGVTNTDTDVFGDGHLNLKTSYPYIRELAGVTTTETSIAYRPVPSFGTIKGYGVDGYTGVNSVRLLFGSGNTPVTFNDYKLDSPISENISISSISRGVPSYDSTTKKWTNTFTCTVNNTSTTESPVTLTISEVGISSGVYTGRVGCILVYREVLETPFTIAAGESVRYVQNLEFTMP